ncbi:hypothetical protein [Acuticoccus mangrovi]|uniref:Uncharacterized protein n=1 Tax=Acuticoccus mangrovi TaxID=2796142 RepID=A0A934IMW7_9HYPH|nr:hypothetical protein [Acuticoccus mangrovi]MBJ3774825.1 hypothetical protein [Acuticoccus mangrovi]
MSQPVIRLTFMEQVDHQPTFDAFAENVARQIVADRVRQEPRVVSLRRRAVR